MFITLTFTWTNSQRQAEYEERTVNANHIRLLEPAPYIDAAGERRMGTAISWAMSHRPQSVVTAAHDDIADALGAKSLVL